MIMKEFDNYKKIYKLKHYLDIEIKKDAVDRISNDLDTKLKLNEFYYLLLNIIETTSYKELNKNIIWANPKYTDNNISSFFGILMIVCQTNWNTINRNIKDNIFELNCVIIILVEEIIEILKTMNKWIPEYLSTPS